MIAAENQMLAREPDALRDPPHERNEIGLGFMPV